MRSLRAGLCKMDRDAELSRERIYKIIHLTKVKAHGLILYMGNKPQFFLGLVGGLGVWIALRKSFLMLATNFLVGIRFSNFFLPSSTGVSL